MVTSQKYRNLYCNGYHSKKEAKRGDELKLMQFAGEIENLREQVPYVLIPAQEGERSIKYVADFVYWDKRTNEEIVEDVKSNITKKLDSYVMKRKLMLYVHGIKIKEI